MHQHVLDTVMGNMVEIVLNEDKLVEYIKGWYVADKLPRNVWGTNYKGVNIWSLWNVKENEGYTSDVWLTINQVRKLGGWIPKEELKNWTPVLWFKPIKRAVESEDGEVEDIIVSWRSGYWKEYNLSQVYKRDGDKQQPQLDNDGNPIPLTVEDLPEYEEPQDNVEREEVEIVEELEKVLDLVPVVEGSLKASYIPMMDVIQVPDKEAFRDTKAYYWTKSHEVIHATGHSSRLDRDMSGTKGSPSYGREELVAAAGASLLQALYGVIDCHNMDDLYSSAGYIRGWLETQTNKEQALLNAMQDAEKAVKFLVDRVE